MVDPLFQSSDTGTLKRDVALMPRDDIVAIQMLRWLAASLIVFVHSEHEMTKIAARSHSVATFSRFVEFGVGVDIFFVISGFLIYHVCRRSFNVRGYSLNFLKRRFLRVVPLYWLATLAMFFAVLIVPSLLNHNVLNPTLTAMSFLLVAWPDSNGDLFPLLNSGWTLNLEFYFYVVFAVALRFRERAAVGLLIAWFAGTVIVAQIWPDAAWWVDFYGQPIVLEFVAGVLLSILYSKGFRLGFVTSATIAVAAILLHIALRQIGQFPRIIGNGLPAGLLFFALVFNRGLSLRPQFARGIRLMGDASYALYLTSPFVINLTFEILSRIGIRQAEALIIASCISATIVAVGVFRFVELPITRAGRRLIRRPPERTVRPTAHDPAGSAEPLGGRSMPL